ncbi:alcohol dehydrogenase (NADP+) [Tremella mesenterica]|uniref:Alcohol dehydrogenase (NADP+) n=1 Tax=Tremella mesenterica TaxID=5217 RepID=A0A4Q1BWQ9_TREME|nr:alcohol dehydrogenase (NADP+) [Tremella mesenterica]
MSITHATGYAIFDPKPGQYDFKLTKYELEPAEPDMVTVAIECCGVCGSDHHTISGGWGPLSCPYVVTGHEVIGKVVEIGSKVTEFKVGQRVGVGAQVGSCGHCKGCLKGNENYCVQPVHGYNTFWHNGAVHQGGYSTHLRAQERFVFPIPDALSSTDAASMLCGGLTTYAPLIHAKVSPGSKVGVIGLGGLGHYAVLFAVALGAEVTVFSRGDAKKSDALKMGAKHYVPTDPGFEKGLEREFDVLICTSSSSHLPINELLSTLDVFRQLVFVGMPENGLEITSQALSNNGVAVASSHLGNKGEAIQMLKLAAEKGVKPWVELMPMKDAAKAMIAIEKGTVRYRTVLLQDIESD